MCMTLGYQYSQMCIFWRQEGKVHSKGFMLMVLYILQYLICDNMCNCELYELH
jgi:hypothetical protein